MRQFGIDGTSITCEEIPFMACEFVKPKKTVSYTVRFIPVINGRDVLSDENNIISVTLCKDGVSEIDYNWRDFIAEPATDFPAAQID